MKWSAFQMIPELKLLPFVEYKSENIVSQIIDKAFCTTSQNYCSICGGKLNVQMDYFSFVKTPV